MKRLIGILVGVALLVSGCGPAPQPQSGDDAPKAEPTQAKAVPMSLDGLQIETWQYYTVYDAVKNSLLLGIYDKEKVGPVQNWNDQVTLPYLIKFVLYDLDKQAVMAEYPVKQFASSHSAVYAFDGVLANMVITTDVDESQTAFFYINAQKMEPVYENEAELYHDSDSQLQRYEDGVMFAYANDVDQTFGVKTMNAAWEVKSLLTFEGEKMQNLWDGAEVFQGYYVYMVQENEQIVCYLGSSVTDATPIVTYPADTKIFGVVLTEDSLLVSQLTLTGDSGYFLERLDWDGNSLEKYRMVEPLYGITTNVNGQLCGVPAQLLQENSLLLFETADSIQPIPIDTGTFAGNQAETMIQLLDGENFLIFNDFIESPPIWLVSVPDPSTSAHS